MSSSRLHGMDVSCAVSWRQSVGCSGFARRTWDWPGLMVLCVCLSVSVFVKGLCRVTLCTGVWCEQRVAG